MKPSEEFGFVVRVSEDDPESWVIDVRGSTPWYVSGFRSRHAAFGWVLDYLTTINENNARLGLEDAERRRESDDRVKLARAALLEQPEKKGREN